MNAKNILRVALASTILIAVPAMSGDKSAAKPIAPTKLKSKTKIRLPLACQPAPECLVYPH